MNECPIISSNNDSSTSAVNEECERSTLAEWGAIESAILLGAPILLFFCACVFSLLNCLILYSPIPNGYIPAIRTLMAPGQC